MNYSDSLCPRPTQNCPKRAPNFVPGGAAVRQGSEQNLRVQSNYELLWALFCRLFVRFGRQYSDKRSRSVRGIASFFIDKCALSVYNMGAEGIG